MRNIFFLIVFFLAVHFSIPACTNCPSRSGVMGKEGFSVGVEFGIDGVNDDDFRVPSLKGIASFGQSLFNGIFDIYSELHYNSRYRNLPKSSSQSNSLNLSYSRCVSCPDFPWIPPGDPSSDAIFERTFVHSLYFNFMLGFNLRFGFNDETALSLILQNEIDELIIHPRFDERNNNNIRNGVFTPSLKFNQELNAGDIFALIGVPITYIQNDVNADTEIGLEFSVGWRNLLGLELQTTLFTQLAPDEFYFDALLFMVGLDIGQFYFYVDTLIPFRDVDIRGVNITPQIDFTFRQLTFYVNCAFSHIGAESRNVNISPALGVKFSF